MLPRLNILVVEDDPDVQRLTRSMLEHSGHSTSGELRGERAISALSAQHHDAACIDLMLPNVSGFELCEFIRATAALRDMTVLVMSSRTLPLDRSDALDAGADGYLAKPFSRSQLLQALEAAYARRQRADPAVQPGGAP